MVLWLTHADDFKQIRIALENPEPRLGDVETVKVWAYDEYFKPISDVDVRVTLSSPTKQRKPSACIRKRRVFSGLL